MMRRIAAVLFTLALAVPALGQSELSDGEVRKVDKEAKKITIKHGPLANLDMPPMTMVFQVKESAMLDQVKAGDKVKFQAEKVGGAFTVTKIEPAK
jgi:Cu(I)/Ag(I) efflux system protein CusF